MQLALNPGNVADYRIFVAAKKLPRFRCRGRLIEVPDEYAHLLGSPTTVQGTRDGGYQPIAGLFDYQAAIAALAIRKRKFAVFADCGLGKTLVLLEFVRHALSELSANKRVLIVSPLMVVRQTLAEAQRWYGDKLPIEKVSAAAASASAASPARCHGQRRRCPAPRPRSACSRAAPAAARRCSTPSTRRGRDARTQFIPWDRPARPRFRTGGRTGTSRRLAI